MKCPACVKSGERSRVYPGASSSTLMYVQPFYDEEGLLHSHDPNSSTTEYKCSRGHAWSSSRVQTCGARGCGYGKP